VKSILDQAFALQKVLNADAIRNNPDIELADYESFGIGPLTPIGPLKPTMIADGLKKFTKKLPSTLLDALEEVPYRYEQGYEFESSKILRPIIEKPDFMGGFRWFNYESPADFREKLSLVNKYNRDFSGHILIPFISIGNGDSLCISALDESVISYSHDQNSHVIAGNLMEFYSAWSSVFFIGPEFWWLDPFCTMGRIDKDLPSSKKLAQFFKSLS
jgi:hypothetical protein